MNKVKILLTLLSVAITVIPIITVVYIYQNNLMGLVIPPEIMNMVNGKNNSNSGSNSSSLLNSFQAPQSVGEPQYNPETKTATFTFNFTNPLSTPITVNTLEADIVSHDDGTFLGNVSIEKALTLAPGQTADITALGKVSDEAINYFESLHPGQNYINIDFINLNVDMAGVKVQVDRQNVGNIPIPPQLFG
jgi:hypothetical protein